MSEPFLAEIRVVGFNFPPRGFAQCDGQILPINQNQSLYSLLGTTYGGDGRTTFALPDLRGRVPVHEGAGFTLGQKGGEEVHTLNATEMPAHTHELMASTSPASTGQPDSGVLFAKSSDPIYHAPTTTVAPAAGTLTTVGGGQAHNNMQPYIAINFCIALQGLFPSRN
ncbi:tail Collar domain-containing protein [Haloferula helveola]|uniref:Tail Collar domain-containing protein n=1 Tax=Haloferula helveola TaxID=490095 RepID=A0ABM7RHN1_9BACT|nr:tail Collar domain-containing protein [Haloferula helveola]